MKKAGDILAESPRIRRALKRVAPLTVSQQKLIDAASVIRMNPGDTEAAYMARELVQCTLPHSNPGDARPVWNRRNGDLTLAILPGRDLETGESYGYPYGVIPRLLLFWIITEAVRTKKRRLELGNSLSVFMRALGLDPSHGGKKGAARSLKEQMRRLFQATISFQRKAYGPDREGEQWLNMQVAPVGELWWNPRQPEQGVLWGSWIELGDKFFQAITAWPVPVDMRVLRAIKRSPLALDLYAWAAWRVFRLDKSAFVPWKGLMEQMGSEYKSEKEFARYAKTNLRKIKAVYPALKLDFPKGGLVLHPSLTAIAPAPKRA